MAARSSLEIASDLDARIAALEAKQREKATGAGKKNEKLLHMREQLQVLDKQRAAKAAELQATRQEEAAEQARKQQPPPPPPPANKSSPDQTSRAATPSAAALPAARPAPAPALAPAPPPPAAAASSSSQPTSRNPRVLLGVCMPHFLGREAVAKLVHSVHEKICAFADVRIVCTREVTRCEGMDSLMDEVKAVSKRGRRLSDGATETTCYTISDQKLNPYHAANELARWADVLLICPMCTQTLTGIATGREDDLLLEIVQSWGAVKKRAPTGEYWLPLKPFIVAPRLPIERRNQLIIERQMGTLEQMGVELVEDPVRETRRET